MNFDGKLDLSILSSDLTVYDDTTPQQLLEMIQNANIIITKEMEVSGEMIRQFPDSVKLICETGTGYNNIDFNENKMTVIGKGNKEKLLILLKNGLPKGMS